MYKHNLGSISLILILILTFHTGCQAAPLREAVVNKTNNSFNPDVVVSAEDSSSAMEMQEISFHSAFDSTDESVHFAMEIEQNLSATTLPVVRVTPHYLTGEDAERAAYALFADTDFYEADPLMDPVLTKGEIQERINLWSQYTNVNSIQELYGDNIGAEYLSDTADLVKKFVEQYTLEYETAPEEDVHVPCEWKMKKSSEYVYTDEELAEVDLDDDNDEISAQCNIDGIPYYYSVSTRNKTDFKVNMISCIIFRGTSPRSIESRIFSSELCRTPESTREQEAAVKEKAAQILSDMELGQWQIDECKINKQIYGDQTEYSIVVNAVPIFNGTPALRRQQLESLQNQDGYAPSQYITDANFIFSAKGELIMFTLYTPLDIEEIVSEHVKTMDMSALLERAQEVLMLTDAYSYSFGSYLQFIDETVQCNVTISEIEYGLSRIRIQDQEDSYYYVPAVQLKGCVEYVGEESGKTFYISEEPETLLHINAVDGTIINQTNS